LTQRNLVSTLEQSPERGDTAATQEVLETAPASETDELTNGNRVPTGMRFIGVGCGRHTQRGDTAVAKGKRTFQPNNRRRARKHGFRLRMRTRAGRAIVSNRRSKGRRALTA
jgi:large subunit ribosomal protein L34